jgi:hypothetical protein
MIIKLLQHIHHNRPRIFFFLKKTRDNDIDARNTKHNVI